MEEVVGSRLYSRVGVDVMYFCPRQVVGSGFMSPQPPHRGLLVVSQLRLPFSCLRKPNSRRTPPSPISDRVQILVHGTNPKTECSVLK